MEEIKVGEYVRNDSGTIIKVKKIEKDMEKNDVWYYGGRFVGVWKSRMLKHSPNIIDLIEVGDYVNGYKVLEKTKSNIRENGIHILIFRTHSSETWETFFEDEIESIVTKEQFNSIKYVIGE